MAIFSSIKLLIKRGCYKIYSLAIQYENEKKRNEFDIEDSVRFHQVSFGGNISIGSHTYINERSRIDSGEKAKVKIGRHCAIGRNVHISAKTHDLTQPTTDDDHDDIPHLEKDVKVGDFVWIGDNVLVLPGVTIHSFAVIGANSLVNRDVESFEVVGGTPIKHIRYNSKHYKYPY